MANTILEMIGYDDLGDKLGGEVDQRLWGLIDREIDSGKEQLQSPGQPTPTDQTVVSTSDNETGTAKIAGTGNSEIVSGIDNRMLYGVGALVGIGIVWAMVK